MARRWHRLQPGLLLHQPYAFTLLLLGLVVVVDYALQPNFLRPASLGGSLRTYLPLILVAGGQTVVIISGGIDLSVGAIVSLTSVVVVSNLGADVGLAQVLGAIALGLAAGLGGGLFNGVCVAYLRLQPIITTFASSFVFSGVALWVMSSPGGHVPPALLDVYLASPLGVPLALWILGGVVLLWRLLTGTRYGGYLYAVGGQPLSAFVSGVPVDVVRLSAYALAGVMSAAAAIALSMETATGDPLVGNSMTLPSVVAVVLGGTRLRGGQGSLVGPLVGVVVLQLLTSLISFANVPSWWQTFANGMVIMCVLAGPGAAARVRARFA